MKATQHCLYITGTGHTIYLAMLFIWAVFAASLLPPSSQRCFKANESQCRDVDFTPGSDLAGEGFDITTMQRKGAYVLDMSTWLKKDKSCTLCKNPYMGDQTQKLPVSVVDWRPTQKCQVKLSSSIYQSSEALVSSSTSSIENNWKAGLHIITPSVQGSLILAGSQSKLAEYSLGKTKKDKFNFASHAVSCGYYRYRVSSSPLLHPEIIKEFGSLPEIYDESSKHLYYKLIDKFGTHYISKVTLGGEVRSVTSIKECEASLQGLSVDEVKMCLGVEASVSIGIAENLRPEANHCKQSKDKTLRRKSFASSFSDRDTNVIGGYTQNVDLLFSSNNDPKAYKEWVASLPAHPDVISYSLESIHELLLEKTQSRAHLRNAIQDYILQRSLLKNCTSPCKIGVKTNPEEPCTCSCHNNPDIAVNCCPTQKGSAKVTVTAIKATGLFGDFFGDETDAFVKILGNEKITLGQTSVIVNNNSPNWEWDFHLGTVDLTHFSSVKLEVWDEDSNSDDDLLGACDVQLKSGVVNDICALNHGLLYYKVQVTCIPGLTGPSCLKYKPSPMDAQLEKVYVSRNARPIPTEMLVEMGVLLDERIPRFNQSNIRKYKGFELSYRIGVGVSIAIPDSNAETGQTPNPAMLQTLLIWAIFSASLLPPSSQRCFKANESQCRDVDFTPGSDLAGEGFDITTMQRKGAYVLDMSTWLKKDKSCTLCKNPYMKGQTQKLPVSVVDWRPDQKCNMKLSSKVYQSSEALVSSSSSSIENNWKVGLHIITPSVQGSLILAGSNSKLAEYSLGKTKKDKFNFASHAVSCGYYRYRVSSSPLLHPEIIKEFGSLPEIYDESSKHLYYKLIDKFGTHYISKVTLGGEVRSVTSIKECEASLQGLSVDEVNMCLGVEASVSKGPASLTAETKHCKNNKEKTSNKKSFASSFTDRDTNVIGGYTQSVDLLFSSNTDPNAYKEWVASLPSHPDVISYALESIHELLPARTQSRAHLRNAIKDYILQRGLLKNCTSPCKTGVNTKSGEPCKCNCMNNPQLSSDCCPTQKGSAEVTVTVIKATGLYGDYWTQTDGFVKLFLKGAFRDKTSIMMNNDNPYWNSDFHLGTEDLTRSISLKIEMFDEEESSEESLGACNVQLKSGVVNDICALNHGLLYYKVQVTCIPGLTGPSCLEYKPSPMDAQLEKVYVSRNARPIPTEMLVEMGVLLDERIPRFNQSNIRKYKGFEFQHCFKANESQCRDVDFTPGSDLAGEGFDITTMQRKGAYVLDMSTWLKKDKSCTLCKNPYMKGQTQKLPVSVVDWRPTQKCTMKLSSKVYQSSEALVSSSSSSIENNWNTGLDIITPKIQGSLILAGSNSKLAEYSLGKTKKDKFSFASHAVSCGYYRYRVSSSPLLHPEIIKEFGSLPEIYDESSKHLYYKLIDKFGTHYISKVTLGGEVRSVTSIKECEASLQGLSVDEVKMCLGVEASVSKGPAANLAPELHHCKQDKQRKLNEKSFASSFNDRDTNVIGGYTQSADLLFSSNTDPNAYKEWVASLPAHPDVISYSLESIHELLPAKTQSQTHLRNAIKDYILQRGLLKNCTSPCKTGVKSNSDEPCRCVCKNPQLSSDCCPTQKGSAEVTVTVIKAKGLYGDYWDETDGFVKLFLNGAFRDQTNTIMNKNNPYWNRKFNLGTVDLTLEHNVKLEVWDLDQGWDDDLLGECDVQLKSGVVNNICTLNHGLLYYKVQVTCIPGLTGPSCSKYKPSPMDAQLEKVYVSRNARPIPRGMLVEMGVLLDEHIPRFNQSNIRKYKGFE
ncbi:hypothetical protein QTP86_030291, partial [Hemibagrus guttatus]